MAIYPVKRDPWLQLKNYQDFLYSYHYVKEETRCEPEYKTETEKPIGTRDPDKFLKEQQDKLWQEMM